jgi:hypothetical protein
MSKTTLALGSLFVGVSVGFFWGNHTSIVVQEAAASAQIANPQSNPGTVVSPFAVPKVPEIHTHVSGAHIASRGQQLDGMDIKDSEFRDMTWEYSGGAFTLANVKISAPMRVRFGGAAANTLALLAIIQAVDSAAQPVPLNPNAPILRTTTAQNNTVTLDFASPYQGNK